MGENIIRNQTFHERLIPLLVDGLGAQSYLELGTHLNETIGKVKCPRRYGVDLKVCPCADAWMYEMTTEKFLKEEAGRYAPFDVVFIDACHDKDSVRSDFIGVWPYVSPEGLVLLHDGEPETMADTAPGFCGNAWEYIRCIQQESVTLPYYPGLTIVRKREHWGPR